MPTQEACEVMYEVMAKSDIVLPSDERDDLRWMVINFCRYEWTTTKILSRETRYEADLVCPDGKTRTLSGQPDLVMYDGARGLIIYDYKTGKGTLKSSREAGRDAEIVKGKQYLSDRGHFQLDTYGLLTMLRYRAAEYVTLRELFLRSGRVREATLDRNELEHIERQLAIHMQQLERAINEGTESKLWYPRPGKQCARQCPVSRSCPVPSEQRGLGAIDSTEAADLAAEEWVQRRAQAGYLRDALKTWHEETGHAPQLSDGLVVRWDPPVGKGRKFDVHEPFMAMNEETEVAS